MHIQYIYGNVHTKGADLKIGSVGKKYDLIITTNQARK